MTKRQGFGDLGAGYLAPAAGAALAALAAGSVWSSPVALAVAAAAGACGAAVALRARPGAPPAAAPDAPAPDVQPAPPPAPRQPGLALLDHLPQGVLLVDAAGRVAFMNQRARRFFGTLPATPFPVEALRVPRLLDAVEAALATEPAGGAPLQVDFTLARATELNLAAHVVALGAAEPAGAAGSGAGAIRALVAIEDLTQARIAEQLHRDFVANASHELKTPLAAVAGLIETLTGHARADPEAQARFLGMMAAQTERMKHLIEDLISLNRIEINERVHPTVPQPVARIVHEAVESLRPLAEAAGMRILAMPPADLPSVPGNREELTQVFVNLIENAVKYGGGARVNL
ncbi:MAG: HAMP domain-containing sensor histidine kinase, partial [Thermohalobaculum sp.]|nr:HAMP domain-containing sensor histidine kinase [Thermohalobaculum sp.]